MNLGIARHAIEALMNDDCTITFDPQATRDDIIDPTTLTATRPPGDTTIIYEGPCSIVPESAANQAVEGGDHRALLRYLIAIPWDAPAPPVGALVHVDASVDPAMTGTLLRVTSVIGRTRVVVRKLRCELTERITDRP